MDPCPLRIILRAPDFIQHVHGRTRFFGTETRHDILLGQREVVDRLHSGNETIQLARLDALEGMSCANAIRGARRVGSVVGRIL